MFIPDELHTLERVLEPVYAAVSGQASALVSGPSAYDEKHEWILGVSWHPGATRL